MTRACLLLPLSLCLTAHAGSPAEACAETWLECKEDCTMEFGTSARTRGQLGPCLDKCTARRSDCEERGIARGEDFEPERPSRPPPSPTARPEPLPERPRPSAREPLPPSLQAPEPAAPSMDRTSDTKLRVEPRRGTRRPVETPAEERAPSPAAAEPEPGGEGVRRHATRAADLPGGESAEPPPPAAASPSEPEAPSPAPQPPPKKAPEKPAPPPEAPKKKRALDEWDPDAL